MKTNLIFLLLGFTILLYSKQTLAQGETMYPIGEYYVPDVELTSATGTIQGPSNVYLGGSHAANYFKANGSSNITVKGDKVVIRRSHIGGNTQPGFRFAAKPGGPSIASNYSYANGTPDVPLFEKIEFGIKLPIHIQNKIDAFLNNNISSVGHTNDYLNPYDPQDISIEANLSFTKTVDNIGNMVINTTVFGFYFQDYVVNVSSDSYTPIPEKYPFRIRISPQVTGLHTVAFLLKYKAGNATITETISCDLIDITNNGGNGTITNGNCTFEFNGIANNHSKEKHKGYLEVGHHKRHLRHSDSKTSYFPLGMNLQELPHFDFPILWDGPIAYETRRSNYFQSMHDHGGNFIRMISYNTHHTIETSWEGVYDPLLSTPTVPYYFPQNQFKLGNYHSNQKHMKEMDRDLLKCEELNLFVLFCLQSSFPFMEHAVYGGGENGAERWAMNSYNIELELDQTNQLNVKAFFIDEDAKRFFSNKLRYAQARWGYSPAIAVWQLTNEIDQFGIRDGQDFNGSSQGGLGAYYAKSTFYDASHLMALKDWTCEMSLFLGSQYPKHLVATNYIVNPFANNNDPSGPYGACTDFSHTCMGIDLITQNSYNYNGNDFYDRGAFESVVNILYNPDNDACIGEETGYFVDKPYLITESGNTKNEADACQLNSMHNTSWAALCSGQAGVPLLWNLSTAWNLPNRMNLPDYFSNFTGLNSFINSIDFETHKYVPSVKSEDDLIDEKGSTNVSGNLMDVEVFIMQNDNSGLGEKSDRGFGWVHHIEGIWEKFNLGQVDNCDPQGKNCECKPHIPTGNEIPETIDAAAYQYNLNGFKSGDYLIEAYDTQNGNLLFSTTANNAISADVFNVLKLGVPLVNLYYDANNPRYDYAFKFWHSSVNNNDLRQTQSNQSTGSSVDSTLHNVFLPGNNDEFKKHFFVSVAPNPTSGELTIVVLGGEIFELTLNEPSGKTIHQETPINKNTCSFNLENYASGLYFLSIKSKEGIVKIFKVIKQ